MAAKRDYYEVLGVSRNADAGTIKKAYRKLAKKYHPDTNPGDKQAEKSFKEVTEAYTILSDPEKKRLYDQFGHSAFDGSGAGQNPHGNPFENAGGGYQEYHFESGNMDDIFGDMFDHIFHGRQSTPSKPLFKCCFVHLARGKALPRGDAGDDTPELKQAERASLPTERIQIPVRLFEHQLMGFYQPGAAPCF